MLTDPQLLAGAAWDSRSLDQLKNDVRQNPQSKQGQLAVARQVESMFVQMMLKSMREALPKDGMLSSEQTRLYTSLYDQQIAQQLGAHGLRLAEMIVKQLSPANPAADTGAAGDTAADKTATNNVPMKFDWQTVASYQARTLNQLVSRAVPKVPAAEQIMPGDNRQFLMKLARPAQVLSQQTGIPHRLILAQAALESGWGQRQIRTASGDPSFNLFGIKASADWKGPVTEVLTTEYENGVAKKVRAKFRVYSSYFESLADYVRLLTHNPRYASVVRAQTPEQGAHALQSAGYATDPAYAQKLTRIIQQLQTLSDKVNNAYNQHDLTNLF